MGVTTPGGLPSQPARPIFPSDGCLARFGLTNPVSMDYYELVVELLAYPLSNFS